MISSLPIPKWLKLETEGLELDRKHPIQCFVDTFDPAKNFWGKRWPLTESLLVGSERVHCLHYLKKRYFGPSKLVYLISGMCRHKVGQDYGWIFADTVNYHIEPQSQAWMIDAVAHVWTFDVMNDRLRNHAVDFAVDMTRRVMYENPGVDPNPNLLDIMLHLNNAGIAQRILGDSLAKPCIRYLDSLMPGLTEVCDVVAIMDFFTTMKKLPRDRDRAHYLFCKTVATLANLSSGGNCRLALYRVNDTDGGRGDYEWTLS